jgi:hypothetical protein
LVSELIGPRVFLLQEIDLIIFAIMFFGDDSDCENKMLFRENIKVSVVKISASSSSYFWKYTLWKIGYLSSPIN